MAKINAACENCTWYGRSFITVQTTSNAKIFTTEPWLRKALQTGEILTADLFRMLGEDTNPADLLLYLKQPRANLAYAAAVRLQQLNRLPEDCTVLYEWATKIPKDFLERRTSEICREILHMKSNYRL